MKRIVIIPNFNKDTDLSVTKKLINALENRAILYMEECFSNEDLRVDFVSKDKIFDNADFVIVLGGDGTILQVAEPCAKRGIPIMGINLGRIGFMTEVNISDVERACSLLLEGKFIIEKRMMIEASVIKNGEKICEFNALNDVVISKSGSPMITVEVHSMGEKINMYSADGLIIATPTGSTGYSLSAGGPVADPTMELFIASPICAHMLHARPALMSSNKPIVLSISDELGADALVMVDGNVKEKISVGDEVMITKSKYTADIIKLGDQSFYDVLIDKLK